MMDEQSQVKTIIVIARYGIGEAEQVLREKLLDSYLGQLCLQETFPHTIFFLAEGVKLVVEGSPFLETLTRLHDKGVSLNACSTCLNYYGLMDKLRVGEASKMEDLVKAQINADKVISL